MTFRTFIFGLLSSFGLAWLLVVVVPFFKMRDLEPIPLDAKGTSNEIYFPKRTGRVANGAAVYAQNGCYLCHTQLVRPTYAGNDMYRVDWGGLKDNGDGVDTRRETNAYDFQYETFAQIGVTLVGPDLSNLGLRVEKEYAKDTDPAAWLYLHLYNPRTEIARLESECPSFKFLFETREIKGNRSNDALPVESKAGTEVVPGSAAQELVSYLLSLKKDNTIPVPASMNFGPPKPEKAAAAAKPAAAPAAK